MFGINVPCAFKTSQGSSYTVEVDSVTRIPFWDPGNPHTRPKNMFYCDEQTSEDLLAASKITSSYRVDLHGFGTVRITFYTDPNQTYILQVWPEVGQFPVDMLLKQDGWAPRESGFHVGHAVSEITVPPAEDVVAAARSRE